MYVQKSVKQLSTTCPVCKQRVEFPCDTDVVEHASFYPVACSFKHCGKTIVIYVDANYKVRGTESAVILSEEFEEPKRQFDAVSPAAFVQPSIERRTIYACLSGVESTLDENIPNVIERQLLHHVYEKKRISLVALTDLVKGLEKALNISIDYALVKRLMGKYVIKGIIAERIIEAG